MTDDMKVESVPVDVLVEDPSNMRVHTERNIEAIKGSLLRFGQQKPLIVGSDNVVIAGNGTLRAARALGWKTVNIVRSNLTGASAIAFAVADNRTAELADWDTKPLVELLSTWDEADRYSVGFDRLDFAELQSSLVGTVITADEQVKEAWRGMPEMTQEDLWDKRRVVVKFLTDEDVQAFAALIGQTITDKTMAVWYPKQPGDNAISFKYVEKPLANTAASDATKA
jgi:hypothetical protein